MVGNISQEILFIDTPPNENFSAALQLRFISLPLGHSRFSSPSIGDAVYKGNCKHALDLHLNALPTLEFTFHPLWCTQSTPRNCVGTSVEGFTMPYPWLFSLGCFIRILIPAHCHCTVSRNSSSTTGQSSSNRQLFCLA